MAEEKHIPARVMALAAQVGDEPLAWKEHDDGTITIVFSNSGKRRFDKEIEFANPIIHTNAEAIEFTKTLPPRPKSQKEKIKDGHSS